MKLRVIVVALVLSACGKPCGPQPDHCVKSRCYPLGPVMHCDCLKYAPTPAAPPCEGDSK